MNQISHIPVDVPSVNSLKRRRQALFLTFWLLSLGFLAQQLWVRSEGSLQSTVDGEDDETVYASNISVNLEAAIACYEQGDLNSAISIIEELCKQNPANHNLLQMRARLGLFRMRLTANAQTNSFHRTRVRRHITQLPQIDQLIWASIERKTRDLTGGDTKAPRAAMESLLSEVREFMLEHHDFLAGWILQARLALLLNNAGPGLVAAFNLDHLGAWETSSPPILKTLAQLDERGWWPRTN